MSKKPLKKIDPIQDRVITRGKPARPFPMYEIKRGISPLIIPLFVVIGIFIYMIIKELIK